MTRLKLNVAKFCKLLEIYADDAHVDKKTEILEPTPLVTMQTLESVFKR